MPVLILGDIKSSRKIKVSKLWPLLQKLTRTINKEFTLSAPMMITLGDEFQLVTLNKDQVPQIIKRVSQVLQEIEFRYVVASYDKDTSLFDTVEKFNSLITQSPVNPLISPVFTKAHQELDKKTGDAVDLDDLV